jgi:hypothetical protein
MAVMDHFVGPGLRDAKSAGNRIGGYGHVSSTSATVTPEMAARVSGVAAEGTYAPNFIPLLSPQQQYDEWLEVQTWMLLSIADGASGPRGSSYDKSLRELFDPKTGTFWLGRGSGRFTTAKAAWDDLVQSQSKAAKSFAVPGREWGGNRTFARIPYGNIITSEATDITRGEAEYIIRYLRPDQVTIDTCRAYVKIRRKQAPKGTRYPCSGSLYRRTRGHADWSTVELPSNWSLRCAVSFLAPPLPRQNSSWSCSGRSEMPWPRQELCVRSMKASASTWRCMWAISSPRSPPTVPSWP